MLSAAISTDVTKLVIEDVKIDKCCGQIMACIYINSAEVKKLAEERETSIEASKKFRDLILSSPVATLLYVYNLYITENQ